MIQARKQIEALAAQVLLVAYDRPSLLAAKMMAGYEVPFPLLLDPEKGSYRTWGMGRTTLTRSVLSPTLTWRYLKLILKGESFLGFAPDMLQLGGDFVLDRHHRITAARVMRHNGDRAPVPELLSEIGRVSARVP